MLIGMFGFYAAWIPWYEVRILPWRKLLKLAPDPATSEEGNRAPIGPRWTTEHNNILETLKREVLSGPVLARPDWSKQFY